MRWAAVFLAGCIHAPHLATSTVDVRTEDLPASRASTSIAAADGLGRWNVTVDHGHLLRLRDRGVVEDVGSRYGVDSVLSVCAVDATRSAFFARDQVTVVGGGVERRYRIGSQRRTACGGGRLAFSAHDGVHVLDGDWRLYPIDVDAIAIDAHGELWASRGGLLYRARDEGLAIEADLGSRITALSAAGDRLWVAQGETLSFIQSHRVSVTRVTLDHATLDGEVVRERTRSFRVVDDQSWDKVVAPIVEKSCGTCHRAGGRGGFDLTSEASWLSRVDTLRERVVVDRDMPPSTAPISDEERSVLQRWLSSR